MNTNLLWIIYSRYVPPICVLPGHSFIGVVRQRSSSFSCHWMHQSFPFRVSADCLLVKKFFLLQGHKYICLYFLLKSFKVSPFKPNCLILNPLIFFFWSIVDLLETFDFEVWLGPYGERVVPAPYWLGHGLPMDLSHTTMPSIDCFESQHPGTTAFLLLHP